MEKTIFLIVLIFVFSSCSKSIYYAYEKGGDYCTLEVTKKEDVIYRAFYSDNQNKEYSLHNTLPQEYIASNIYIYIYSDDSHTEEFISIRKYYDMYLLRVGENKFDTCVDDIFNETESGMFIFEEVTKDSLDLLWTSNIKKHLLKEACFRENAITWFPPYMKRIKKIDYKKFNLPQIETKHLKNPKNAPKVSD